MRKLGAVAILVVFIATVVAAACVTPVDVNLGSRQGAKKKSCVDCHGDHHSIVKNHPRTEG
jgi:cytochrome c553